VKIAEARGCTIGSQTDLGKILTGQGRKPGTHLDMHPRNPFRGEEGGRFGDRTALKAPRVLKKQAFPAQKEEVC